MNTTITEISNIFNLMVQADSRLKFYHFGWRSDINKNIDNNFDKGVKTGRLFPALHFDVPDFFQPSEELNYLGFKEDIAVNLYFDDLQNYDNSGEQKTDNLIEQWADLKQIAEDFISNLSEVLQYYKAGFIRTVPRFEPKSNLFNDRLITFEVSFTIAHISECTEEVNKIDFLSLPGVSSFISYDLENYLKEIPSIPTDKLSLWLKGDAGVNGGSVANGDPVSIWSDQSGKGNDFTQSTFINQPTFLESGVNGQKGLSFTNPNILVRLSADFFIGEEGVVFVVVKKNSPSTGGVVAQFLMLGATGPINVDNKYMIFYAVDNWGGYPNNNYFVDMFTLSLDLDYGTSGTDTSLLTVKKSNTDTEGKRDGIVVDSGTGAQSLNRNTYHSVGQWYNNSRTLEGEIYEIIIYEELISDADIITIENYLKNKYAIV